MTSRQILSEAHFVPALAIHAALSVRSISSVLSVLIRDFPTILEIWAVLIGDIFQQDARSTCPGSFTLLARVGLLAVLMEHLTITKSFFVGQFNFHSEVLYICFSFFFLTKLPLRGVSWWSSPAASSSGFSSHRQHYFSPAKNDPFDWSKVLGQVFDWSQVLWQIFWLIRSIMTSISTITSTRSSSVSRFTNPWKKILVILGEDLINRRLVVAKVIVINSNAAKPIFLWSKKSKQQKKSVEAKPIFRKMLLF